MKYRVINKGSFYTPQISWDDGKSWDNLGIHCYSVEQIAINICKRHKENYEAEMRPATVVWTMEG